MAGIRLLFDRLTHGVAIDIHVHVYALVLIPRKRVMLISRLGWRAFHSLKLCMNQYIFMCLLLVTCHKSLCLCIPHVGLIQKYDTWSSSDTNCFISKATFSQHRLTSSISLQASYILNRSRKPIISNYRSLICRFYSRDRWTTGNISSAS